MSGLQAAGRFCGGQWCHLLVNPASSCLFSRGGTFLPAARLRASLISPAATPERQPRSEVWPGKPVQSGSLPVHTQPSCGLFHSTAAGVTRHQHKCVWNHPERTWPVFLLLCAGSRGGGDRERGIEVWERCFHLLRCFCTHGPILRCVCVSESRLDNTDTLNKQTLKVDSRKWP